MEFIGNNLLTAKLQEQVQAIVERGPWALQASLNCVQDEEARNVLDTYNGNFVYVCAAGGYNYATFLVRVDDQRYYTVRIYDVDLPHAWRENVPSL
jgi:hypothetical protein